jgi:UDP-N-acetyl-D-mannosaminuronic acid dehydrogenase
MAIEKICVLGLGYIGLPTASILANKGFKVLGVDVSKHAVDTINRGEIHIVEPDLDILVRSAVNSGNLTASTKPAKADAFIICVPTPLVGEDDPKAKKKPDLSYVEAATKSIVPVLEKGNLVVLESTSPPGTTRDMVAAIVAKAGFKVGSEIYVAHCPERVLPGQILKEAVGNDRVIGGINEKSAQVARDLYGSFVAGNIFLTDATTAEMCKLTENSFRDVNIAFANELSVLADEMGINVWELIELANKHPRVNILSPGPGVGGHCIAVDPWFIVDAVPGLSRLIRTAREVNDAKPDWVVRHVLEKAKRFKKPVIGLLGLAYKNDIDDLRSSPAVRVAKELKKAKVGKLLVCEPNVKEYPGFTLVPLDEVIRDADILVVLTNHRPFYGVDREILKEKVVIDTRGMYN